MNHHLNRISDYSNSYQRNSSVLHTLTDEEIREKEWLLSMMQENSQRELSFNGSLWEECYRFASFAGTILPSFAAGLATRRMVRNNKRLNQILQFRELLPVRNNIEKGSFAYDCLLFKQPAFRIFQNRSHLANLVCLAILFGDEFIDGIAVKHGKQRIQSILSNGNINYYLQFRTSESGVELFYEFDIRDMLPGSVLNATNEKYGISYSEFYNHLLFLLAEMNLHLNKLKGEKALQAAALICSVCNKCFDTYKMDVVDFTNEYSFNHLLGYHQKKDDEIIHVLLKLRALLLDRDTLVYEKQFANWSTMVRSMQLYDDMQDAAVDCDYQMNFICYFARVHFTNEWNWLQENKYVLNQAYGIKKHQLVNENMPGSVMLCTQYARSIIQQNLNWIQKKITGYLWKKNWFGWDNPVMHEEGSIMKEDGEDGIKTGEKITALLNNFLDVRNTLISEDMIYAHLIDAAFMYEDLKVNLCRFLGRKQWYLLTNHLFDYPILKKSEIARRWVIAVHDGMQHN